MAEDVDRWMNSGAEVIEGLRLLSIYAPNRWLAALVSKSPDRFAYLLKDALEPFTSEVPMSRRLSNGGGSFRKEWPFLSEPDCPPELKALAADMITSWHNYVDAHEELFSCGTPEACYQTAEKTIKNFIENSSIRLEFRHYKNTGRVLGRHPIFAVSRRLDSLRLLPATALVRKRENIRDRIWRAEREIGKGDRPDLKDAREKRASRLRLELAELDRMIDEYERADKRITR